ncbi:hypothetical protein C8J56DRAFT_900019 [Mycena floridula]|nr:hypothetical protein C8J56DRAFT_900019 [Mycena floridula]
MAAAALSFNGMQTFGISVPAASGIPNPGPIDVNISHLTSASRMPSLSQSQPLAATFPDMNPPVPACGRHHGHIAAAQTQPRLMEKVTSSAPRPAAEMNCLFQFGDRIFVNIDIHVYPNQPPNCELDDLLTWERKLPINTNLGQVFQYVKANMEAHSLKYQFPVAHFHILATCITYLAFEGLKLNFGDIMQDSAIMNGMFWNGLENLCGDIEPMYQCMSARPDNTDTNEQCKKKETEVSAAFMEYISGTGEFGKWTEYKDDEPDKDPVRVWENFKGNSKLRELATFVIRLLKVVVNQAGCKRLFSDVKIKQTDHRVRITLDKLGRMTKVHSDIKDEHQKKGLIKDRAKRKNHSSTEKLLLRTLESLFKGAPKPPPRIQPTNMEIEAELMQALAEQQAEQDEDDIPDDGAIEVDSDEEYCG